ncbi:MAG: hypothetical protein ACRDHN_00330 [Thermomicrobiales bacterium]
MLAQLLRPRIATIGRLVVIIMVLTGLSRVGWSALAQSDPSSNAPVVIAQGLVVPPESAATWRVREIEPLSSDDAESTPLDFSFAYATTGQTVVRNDVTGKRARIEDGEAYYFSAGDNYTRYRYGDDEARMLLIEFVTDTSESQPLGVHFESDTIESVPGGVYDYELAQGTLAKGAKSALGAHDGPALIYVLSGSLTIAPASGDASTVEAAGGIVVNGQASLTAGNDGAVYLVASFAGRVLDPGETPEATEETTEATPEASETATAEATIAATPAVTSTPEKPLAPSADEDRDGLLNGDETKAGTDPRKADTDGDGLKDGDEIKRYKTDPLKRDTDGDGLDDGDEVTDNKTNPTKKDTDGDGATDGDEWFIYGTDPTDKNDHP